MKAERRQYHPGLHLYAIFVAGATFVLIIAGALVTSNDAALSIPSWPGPLRWPAHLGPGGQYELGHRYVAGTVSLLTVILALWLWRRDGRPQVRRLGGIAVLTLIGQAALGGITVLFELPVIVSVSHACLAQIFFCIMVSLALFTGETWDFHEPRLEDSASPTLRQLAVAATGAVFIQLVLGAAFRHKGFGIIPHVLGAGAVTVTIVWLVGRILTRHREEPRLRRPAIWLGVLLALQLALGVASYWMLAAFRNAPQPLPPVVGVTTAHVAVGALVLAASLVITYQAFRLAAPAPRPSVGVAAERATV